MIQWSHAWAITLRHLRLLIHDVNMQIALFFWPFLNIVVWGYLGIWMQNQDSRLQLVLIGSIFLWEIINRSSITIALGFLEELWAQNLTVLFATPLKLSEWVLGIITYSALTTIALVLYCFALIKYLYAIPTDFLLRISLLFGPPLFLASIALGFLALQVVLYRGKRASEFVFLIVWIMAPLSGAFYPREVLPAWVQAVGNVIPMSYIFSALRRYILKTV